jgi:hypothetical protein
MEQVIALIHNLIRERFFGSLTLKFESGKIVVLKKEETIKPQPYRDNRGESIEHTNS